MNQPSTELAEPLFKGYGLSNPPDNFNGNRRHYFTKPKPEEKYVSLEKKPENFL